MNKDLMDLRWNALEQKLNHFEKGLQRYEVFIQM